MLTVEHHDTADEEDHGQKEATETAKPTHTHINRATSTSASAPVPLLVQTRPRKDLDPNPGVSLDPNQSRNSNIPHIRSLKERLRSTIHTAEVLLAAMMTPVQSPAQVLLHIRFIKRMSDLTYDVADNLMDIRLESWDTEFKGLSTSII